MGKIWADFCGQKEPDTISCHLSSKSVIGTYKQNKTKTACQSNKMCYHIKYNVAETFTQISVTLATLVRLNLFIHTHPNEI